MTESFAKKVVLASAKIETEEEQRGFMKGVDFVKENIWHDSEELPDPDKCIFAYNPETDCYDWAYYEKVGKGYRWAYIEDIFSKEMYEAYLRHEKEREEKYG